MFQLVQSRDGYEACCEKQGSWVDISREMGAKPSQGALFKMHYKRILLPYDLSLRGDTTEHIHQKVYINSDLILMPKIGLWDSSPRLCVFRG